MSLTIKTVTGAGAFEELGPAWDALFDTAAGNGVPFRSLQWARAWWEHMGSDRIPHLIAVHEGSKLVGLLPACEETVHPAGLPMAVKRLSFLGERHGGADYLDVLAQQGREEEIASAIVDHLVQTRPFDICDLEAIDAGSPLVKLLQDWLQARMTPAFTCPQVDLAGDFAAVLSRSKRGDNFKRRLKQMRALQGYEFRHVTDAAQAVEAFDRFLELHEKRWSVQGGSDAMGGAAIRGFHRDVVVSLARAGRLSFDELWAEGACRATIYGIRAGTTYCFYQSGYDPAWSGKSVGLLCLGLSIEAAQASGNATYDLLRGTESYKFDWSTSSRELVTARIIGRSLGAALYVASEGAGAMARQAAHAVLPPAAVDRLRRWRRALEHHT